MRTGGPSVVASFTGRFQLRGVLLILISLSIFVLLIGGCANVGKDFPDQKVPEIRIGETTREDIRSLFGSPWRVGLEDGQRTWTYGRYRAGLFGAKAAKDLTVRFDDHGIVTSYSFSTTRHDE
jgi:hypothetical protein